MKRWSIIFVAVALAVAAVAVISHFVSGTQTNPQATTDVPPGSTADHLTFHRDVAPIIYSQCVNCHHAGGSGPFSLVTFSEAHKRAAFIAEVTARKLMPPWMPDGTCPPLLGELGLSDRQIDVLQRWAQDGAPEGSSAQSPPPPTFSGDWTLGTPDLVVKLTSPYTVPADGQDVYRNFVLPVGLDAARTVRAVELRSGNPRVVHHTSLLLDNTNSARRRAAQASGSGYDGMDPGAGVSAVQGRFLMWQPGSSPCIHTEDMPWRLPAGSDVVLQMHLRPSGKPEPLAPEIGLYFTDRPPAPLLFKLMLRSTSIDIPAEDSNYAFDRSYVLPVDAEALATNVHCHYLGKDLHGFAELPDGKRQTLMHIPNWDFNWQGAYTYQHPVPLPRGTRLQMHFTYDNSAQNPHNPASPPKHVSYGLNSNDEMGEFWLVLRLRNQTDYDALIADYQRRFLMPDTLEQLESLLSRKPDDAQLHAQLAQAMLAAGERGNAMRQLQSAFELRSDCALAHRLLASILFEEGRYSEAADRYRKAVTSDPSDCVAQADLGLSLACGGDFAAGIAQLQLAIELNPRDALTHTNLARVLALQHKLAEARAELQIALRLNPDLPLAIETQKELDSAAPDKP